MRFDIAISAISAIFAISAITSVEAFQAPNAVRISTRTSGASPTFTSSTAWPAAATSAVSLKLAKSPKKSTTSIFQSSDAAAEAEDPSPSPSPSSSSSSSSTVGGGTASIPNEIFNLVKSIVGAGVLSLPAGIAAFGNAPSAALPAIFLITLIGFFSGYGFSLIGRVCSYEGSTSYRGAWDKSIGESTSWIPAATCTLKTCFAVLAYSMILADTIQSLASSVGLVLSRNAALVGITSTVLLPLCLLKNLSSLAPFSLLGSLGMGYTALAMGWRYFDGSYKLGTAAVKASKTTKAVAAIPAGKFLANVPPQYQPQFGPFGAPSALTPNVFILICMLSTAYMAHFNAPKFFVELKDNTIKRYNTVVGTSFGISVLLFGLIGSLGFLTFGGNCSGLILNNYSNGDLLMGVSRIAVAVSLIFSFPLAFVGARDGWLDLLSIPPARRTPSLLNQFTLAILGGITLIASQLKELAFIMSFAGATLGNALIYVYPALMFRGAVKKMEKRGEKSDKEVEGLKREVPFAMFSAGLGVVMGAIGTKMALGML